MNVQLAKITVEEFEQFLRTPTHTHEAYELIEGTIAEKMPTEEHGQIVLIIGAAILAYLKANPIGRVGVEVRHRVIDDLYNDRLPDLSVRITDGPAITQGAVPGMPDLAVEVQSPDDTLKQLSDKAAYYLANGSRAVWLVYTEKRLVEVLTASSRQLLGIGETVKGGDILAGFNLPVSEIFAI